MSLGSRITKRGKAAIVASLASTPREPLLFLYPQWMRKSSTAASDPCLVRNGRPPILSARRYTAPSMKQSDTAVAPCVDAPYETKPVGHEPELPSGQTADNQSHGGTPAAERGLPEFPREMIRKQKMRKCDTHSVKSPGAITSLSVFGSNFQKRIGKAMKAQERAKNRTLQNRTVRKVYQANRKEGKQSWIPDWRVILADLRKNTPRNDEWLNKAVCISVPETAVEKLFHGVDDNMWDIGERYSLSVELTRPDSVTKTFNEFLLSGPARAISKAAAEVMQIAPGSKLKTGPQSYTSSEATPSLPIVESDEELNSSVGARLVRSERRTIAPATRADKIPRPSQWTTRTFADYVDALTDMHLPNHMHRLLYKKDEDHIQATITILREVFTKPECRSSLSRAAFNKALDFFVKTNNIADARASFVLMEMMHIRMDPETFNILLRGTAKNEDLHNFQFILHLMLKRGILPNGKTWLAFLMANYDYGIKSHIVVAMKERGLLAHPSVFRGVCEQLIPQEVSHSLDRGQSQEEFLKHMDSRYEYKWLTTDGANRVLHALGSRWLISRCWKFLQVMDARHVKIDPVSINTILNHCKQAKNVVGAIEIIKRLPSFFQFVPDQTTYHALFELAWRSRSFNIVRTVWKYACLNAATTRRMRLLVFGSLQNAASDVLKPDASQYDIWKQQAGLFIISNVLDHPANSSADKLSGFEPEPIIQGMLSKGPRQRHKVIQKLIDRDCEVYRRWRPTRPFGDMLEEAWERDQDWRVRMSGEWAKLDWKLESAIAVPLHDSGATQRHTDRVTLEWK